MTKRPEVIALALSGQLADALKDDRMPDLRAGSCVGLDTNIFFSDKKKEIAEAKAICATCPVATACATWAVRYTDWGIYGGLTAKERVALSVGKKVTYNPDVALELKFILTATLSAIAAKYSVDQRTVLRWRNILKDYQLAA